MRNQHLRGTTDQLNRLSLPAGRVALNSDNGNIRFWDGETLGGYEVETQQAYDPPYTGPGPQELVAGNLETGFYGEVGPEEFISYGDLSTLVGLSAGTLQNQDQPWLKFSMDDLPCYVAKRTIRHSITHDQLAVVNLVYGDRSVEIGRITYVIRLLTGLDDSGTLTAGGEWNRLIYPIHVDDPNQQGWGINYTNRDLNVRTGNGNGYISWTQETNPDNTTQRVYRGNSSVEALSTARSAYANAAYGWRPILIPIG